MYNDGFRLRYGYAPIAVGVRFSFAPTEEHFHNEIEMLLILYCRKNMLGQMLTTLAH